LNGHRNGVRTYRKVSLSAGCPRRNTQGKSDHQLSDVVKVFPTPAHTIDHVSVHVGQPGADTVIDGDMIHSPLQARYPELCMGANHDRAQGGYSGRALFERLYDTETLLCTGHFPSPSTGRLTRWGDGFRFNPV
jgi:glyoxylase-like metal-dependent hydrolase (beta-lactamase superfamily II)